MKLLLLGTPVIKILLCQLPPKNDAGALELICRRLSAFVPLTRICRQNIAQR
jgi:hypothetical protein